MSDDTSRIERCRASRMFMTYGFSVLAFVALVGVAEHWYTCVACAVLFLFAWLLNPLPGEWHSELVMSGTACGYVLFDIGLKSWCGWLSMILLLCLAGWLALRIRAVKKRNKIR